MKVLKVIHGYPNRFSAGSEVYSQILCHELVEQGCEVVVFTRQENAYKREYSIEWDVDPECADIQLCLVNKAHSRDGYRHGAVDEAFGQLLDQYQPDVIHIGHLNHLSTSIVLKAQERDIPIVFTLHDFWLMCPRGQFLQAINSKGEDLYPVCHSQENEKCAKLCYWRYFSHQEDEEEIGFWTNWVEKRMNHIRQDVLANIDLFIAPSRYLMQRFVNDFSVDPSKIVYLDYGFRRDFLRERKRSKETLFTFGYIGTHKQAKGIFHLIQGFNRVHEGAQLKIWGSPLEPFTGSLQSYVSKLNHAVQKKIHWEGGYKNQQVLEKVFNHVDAIVVPSIWGENSPLVIHEALEAKVPVITADFGGMKEYIQHEVNGLLFEHRDPSSLSMQMKRFIEDPVWAKQLGKRGYLQADDGRIPGIEEHVKEIKSYYRFAIDRRKYEYKNKTGPMAHHI
ncbi:MAG: Glycogen synthase [Chlamydiae bacterium]|nr:Glycogen synthase [Chlamydiota bacterium]